MTALILQRKHVPANFSELSSQLQAAKRAADGPNPIDTGTANGIPRALGELVGQLADEPFDYQKFITHKLHPEVDDIRIQIPTAHILGKEDPVRDSGLKLVDMCDARYTYVYEHKGAHEVPRGTVDLQKIKDWT